MINNKKINHKLILGFLCFLFLFSIQAKAIVVPEIAGNVDLTTNFKDNTWGKSAIFTEFTDSNGIKAIVKTKLYLMHDKDNLYVGFECLDQNPKKLISNDRYLPDGDAVFLVLDTFHDGLAAYAFGSNPSGNKLTGVVSDYSPHLKFAFSTDFTITSKLTPNGYNLVMIIPLNNIPYDWQKGVSTMSFRAVRLTHQKQEFNYPYIRHDKKSGALIQYQTIKLENVAQSNYDKPWFDVNAIINARKKLATGYDLNTFTGRSEGWGVTDSSVADYKIFPSHALYPSKIPTRLKTKLNPTWIENKFNQINFYSDRPIGNLEQFLKRTQTTSFIVILDGKIVYEKYFNGFNQESIMPAFSMTKSFLSALVGIAINRKQIHSIDDPITKYLPELLLQDKHFAKIKIKDLLQMSAGLRAIDSKPYDDIRKAYFSPNLRQILLQTMSITESPGCHFSYNDYSAQLVGLIVMRATHQNVTQLLQNEIWEPLGMPYGGSWSIDSKEDDFEQMAVGLNAPPIDYARFGLLYLQDGSWGNKQIIPKNWITVSTQPTPKKSGYYPNWDEQRYYQYFWWGLKRPSKTGNQNDYLAIGHRGQYLYISPQKRLVIVRTGIDPGLRDDFDWAQIFYNFASSIGPRAGLLITN